MKPGALLPNLKAWSNFRLMVVIGSVVTLSSLALGAVVVQAALSNNRDSGESNLRTEGAVGASPGAGEDQDAPPAEAGAGAGPAAPAGPDLNLEDGASFRVSCPVGSPTSMQNTCQVESFNGFAGRVELSCAQLPPNLSCSFTPSSVVPRANGSTAFRLELSAGQIPPGSYVFQVVGRSGSRVNRFPYPWGVAAPRVAEARRPASPPPPPAPGAPPATPAPQTAAASAEPTFSFTCGSLTEGNKVLWSLSEDGETVKINCFLTPLNGFDEDVDFEFAQNSDLAKPNTASFVVDQLRAKKQFDLNFQISDAVKETPAEQLKAGRDYVFEVTGTSASGKSLTRQVTLTVTE